MARKVIRLVFSYIRFSTPEQRKGDSLRRQKAGEKWIADNGHTPANMTLQDLGVRAFRGENRQVGALAKFLEVIGTDRVPVGSILLLEHLDRLSRAGIDQAVDLFKQILRAGVTIVTLRPSEDTYTPDSLNDPLAMMKVMWGFDLAHQESAKKADRLRAAWDQKRKDAREKGTKLNRRRPAWLDWRDGRFVFNGGVEAIRYIFDRTAEGVGQRQLLAELQKRFTPIGPSGQWNLSYIQKVLNDRAVLGELQPKSFDKKGNRVPDGQPIPKYYPQVIGDDVWLRAQAAKANNFKAKGPSGEWVNPFVGLLVNAHDGHPMHIQTARRKRQAHTYYVQRRLVSYGHLSKVIGADPVTVMYDQFEMVVLRHLGELRTEDLESKGSLSLVRQRELELAGVEKRLNRLEADMAEVEDDDEYASLKNSARMAREKRDTIKADLDRLRAELAADQPLKYAHDVLKVLASATGDELLPLRRRLRSLVAELVERIWIKPEKHFGRVYTLCQIQYKNGSVRQIFFGPGTWGGSVRQVTPDEFANEFKVDLSNKKTARKQVFGPLAKMLSQPGDVVIPKTIPATVGEAVEVWLKVAKSRMSKASFRVVPSKVYRLVEFLGDDLPVKNITQARWSKWTEWVKGERKAGRLAAQTARVTWCRSREFVTWLIEDGACPPIPGLKGSSIAWLK